MKRSTLKTIAAIAATPVAGIAFWTATDVLGQPPLRPATISIPHVTEPKTAAPTTESVEIAAQTTEMQAESRSYAGITHAVRQTRIGAPVEDRITFVASVGRVVRAGETVLELDGSVQAAALASSEKIAQDGSAVRAAEIRLADAHRQLRHTTRVFENHAGNRNELDAKRTAVEQAEADLDNAKHLQNVAELNVVRIKAELARRTIKAPHDGIVAVVWHTEGELARLESPVLKLVQMDELLVRVAFPAEQFNEIRKGNAAYVEINGRNESIPATVEHQPLNIDPVTGSCCVVVRCPNRSGELRPGMMATVSFPAAGELNVAAATTPEQDNQS